MYELARGIVELINSHLETPEQKHDDALRRIFAFLEQHLQAKEDDTIPNLIRLTMCDWLGRQSQNPPVFATVLTYSGPQTRTFLVTAEGKMPFRSKAKLIPQGTLSSPQKPQGSSLPLPTLPFDSSEPLAFLFGEAWSFTFYRYGQHYLLSVVCGSVGLYELEFVLNQEEVDTFAQAGKSSIVGLAKRVMQKPSAYQHRKIHIPHARKMHAKNKTKNEPEP